LIRIIILRNVFGLPQKMELRCLFLWFYKRSDKDGKTHYCFMPMVHMVIPWMPIFHQQDPYSTEVLFMPLRTFEVVKI
jgi:hypothetical protein